MIPRNAAAQGPYRTVDCDTGRVTVWDTLDEATEYAGRLLSMFDRTSATYNVHGQLVGSTETLTATGFDGDAA